MKHSSTFLVKNHGIKAFHFNGLCLFLIFHFICINSLCSQREYITKAIDDYILTNTSYFCIPENNQNASLTMLDKDLFSTIKYANAMSEVAKNGKQQTIGNMIISSNTFCNVNTGPFGEFITKLRMVVVRSTLNPSVKKPCILISIGGANSNLSEIPFLTAAVHYALKGYTVAFYENPNVDANAQFFYLVNKNIHNNTYPNESYVSSLYLGYQVARAAAKYLAFNAISLNIDPNQFYTMGLSYGAMMALNLSLGDDSNYYVGNELKYPFNKLGIPDRFLNAAMRQAEYTIKSTALWSIAYPKDSIDIFNPFGQFIDKPSDVKVIHFHGLLDDEISYKKDWLNFTPEVSLYCDGPTNIDSQFKKHGVPYKAFIHCNGGHGVIDSGNHPEFPKGVISDFFKIIDFNDLPTFYQSNKETVDALKYSFIQCAQIADTTTHFFIEEKKKDPITDIQFIKKISGTNPIFVASDCRTENFCALYNDFVGSPCDDLDSCTVDDKVNQDCICIGNYLDADMDGICDKDDLCPGKSEPGSSCNDGDSCTINDIVAVDCNCKGTYLDTDGDGVCDFYDKCAGLPDPGSICNDQDSCTINDMYNDSCVCIGIYLDSDNDGTCDAFDLCTDNPEPGSPCDDGNGQTIQDTIGLDCMCHGTTSTYDLNQNIYIYPNPFDYNLTIKNEDRLSAIIIIYPYYKNISLDGTESKTPMITHFKQSGVYILELIDKKGIRSIVRIIKI